MKKAILSLPLLGLLALGGSPFQPVTAAADEFWEVGVPSAEQQCVLLGIEREIQTTQIKIQAYHTDLLDDPCEGSTGGDPRLIDCRFYRISPATNASLVPLLSERETSYGRRERWFITELATIVWDDKKISNFRLLQRRELIGAGNTMIKTISAPSQIPATDPGSLDVDDCLKMTPEERGNPQMVLDLIVREIFSSGRGGTYTFRFPTKKDVQIRQESRLIGGKRQTVDVAFVRDTTEKMAIDGVQEAVNVIYVRDYNQRISIAREYLRMLKLTLRRVDWNTRAANFRRAAEIERVMKNSGM